MARVGATNPTELSRKLGPPWTDRDQQRKLYKWHEGSQHPNGPATIALIRAAGLLREDEAAAALPTRPNPADRLAALEAKIEAQGASTTKALRALTRAIERLPGQLAPGAQSATTKRG